METQKTDKISVAVLREKIIKTAAVLQLLADRDVEIEHLKEQLEKLISKYRERTAVLNEFKSNLSEYKQYVENVNKANEALKKEVENLKTEHTQLQVSFNNTSHKYQSTCEEFSTLEKENEKQLTEINNLKQELKKVNKKLQAKKTTKDVKVLKDEIAYLRKQLGLKDAEIDALEGNALETCITDDDDDADKTYKIEELTNELTQIKAENTRLKTQQYYSQTLFVSTEEVSKLREKHRQEVRALKQSHNKEIMCLQAKIDELRIENNLLGSSENVENGILSPISSPNSPKHLNLVSKEDATYPQLSDNEESSESEKSKSKSPTSKIDVCDKKTKSPKVLKTKSKKCLNKQQNKLKSKTESEKVQRKRQSSDETVENTAETVKLPSVMSIFDIGMDDFPSKSVEGAPEGDSETLVLEKKSSSPSIAPKDLDTSSNKSLLEQEPVENISKIQDSINSNDVCDGEKSENTLIEENRTHNEKSDVIEGNKFPEESEELSENARSSQDDSKYEDSIPSDTEVSLEHQLFGDDYSDSESSVHSTQNKNSHEEIEETEKSAKDTNKNVQSISSNDLDSFNNKKSMMQSLFGEDELSDSEENSICSSNFGTTSNNNEASDFVTSKSISNINVHKATIKVNSSIKKINNVKEKPQKKQKNVKKLVENKCKSSPKRMLRSASKSVEVSSKKSPQKTSNSNILSEAFVDSDSESIASDILANIFKDTIIPNLLSPPSNFGQSSSEEEAEEDDSVEQPVKEVNNPKSLEQEKIEDILKNTAKVVTDNSSQEVAITSKNENGSSVLTQNFDFVHEISHCSTDLTANNSPSGESGYESSCTNYTTLEKIIGDSITCLKDSELSLISNPCIQPDVSSEHTRFLISKYKNAKITSGDSSHEKHYANSISTDRSESPLFEYSDDDVCSEVNGWTVSVADDFKPSDKMCQSKPKKHTKVKNPTGRVRKKAQLRKNAKQKKVIIETVRKLMGKQIGIGKSSRKEKVLKTIPVLRSPRKAAKRKLEQEIKVENSPPPQTIRINYVKSGDSKISISEILAKRKEAIKKLKTANTTIPTQQEPDSVEEPVKKFKRPNAKKMVLSTPLSPLPETETPEDLLTEPVIIPAEKPKEMTEKLADRLFQELLTYAFEESTLQKISNEFVSQDSDRIAFLVMKRIMQDIHDVPDKKYTPPVPPTTETQRVLLGFMTNLEKLGFDNLIESFLNLAERQILITENLEVLDPLSRFYTICCLYKTDLYRVRKFCCDIVYYMGNYAVPCIFTILSCWLDVLPPAEDAPDVIKSPLVKAIVHVLFSKTCTEAGYNLASLHLILTDYCKFKRDDFNGNLLLSNFLDDYIKKRSNDLKYAIMIICKNQPTSWVSTQLKKLVKPLTEKTEDNGSLDELRSLTQEILKHVAKTNPIVAIANSWFCKL